MNYEGWLFEWSQCLERNFIIHHFVYSFPYSTQVSLLPPPCDELTTIESFRKATRVRPPGMIEMRSPDKMNGRRSTWRPSTVPSQTVGCCEKNTSGCAI